jgi:hypothetical protein
MSRLYRCCRVAGAPAALAGALLAAALTAPPAHATRQPPDTGPAGMFGSPPVTRIVVTGGMPGWQVALIAIGAALAAAVLAVLADRALAARGHAATWLCARAPDISASPREGTRLHAYPPPVSGHECPGDDLGHYAGPQEQQEAAAAGDGDVIELGTRPSLLLSRHERVATADQDRHGDRPPLRGTRRQTH